MKKVVREEPFGHSNAIKVVYDDGSYGLKALPSERSDVPEYQSPALKNTDMIGNEPYIQYRLEEMKKAMKGPGSSSDLNREPISSDQTQKYIDYIKGSHPDLVPFVKRAEQDLDTEDPEDFEALKESMEGTRPEERESTYQEWLNSQK